MTDDRDDKKWVPFALAGCGLLFLVGFCSIVGLALVVADRQPAAEAPGGPDPSGPGPVPGAMNIAATVTSVTGSQPVPVGASCAFAVEEHPRPDGQGTWCRSQIACGGRLLYGGSNAGYYPCQLGPGRVRGRDADTTSRDSDAAIEIDSGNALLSIRDDATGAHGAYVLTARITQVQ